MVFFTNNLATNEPPRNVVIYSSMQCRHNARLRLVVTEISSLRLQRKDGLRRHDSYNAVSLSTIADTDGKMVCNESSYINSTEEKIYT